MARVVAYVEGLENDLEEMRDSREGWERVAYLQTQKADKMEDEIERLKKRPPLVGNL